MEHTMTKKKKAAFDGPWKDILDRYFEEFIAFCWPSKYDEIDWTKGYTMRDKELSKIMRDSNIGDRTADKLVQIHLKNGTIACILLHIELQRGKEACFEERMFTYRVRLRDFHPIPVTSLAILLDDDENWRPTVYREELWGSSIEMHFPIIKIIDYRSRIPELEASSNPFAEVILAQLASMKKESPEVKLNTKIGLIKRLLIKKWTREDITALYRFIDWVIALPPELELEYHHTIEKCEEELKVSYVTTAERIGIKRGETEMLVSLLENKFQTIPEKYLDKIKHANPSTLIGWAMKLLRAPKIEDVFAEEDTLVTS
jgi:hypothetical protein